MFNSAFHVLTLFLAVFFISNHLFGASSDCSEMEVYDVGMSMCMPFAMKAMPMSMVMVHGNAFIVGVTETGPRGRNTLAAPNMIMTDLGKTWGDYQYLNLDYMGTVERWTFPDQGYPELLQIGDVNNQGVPYLDAQHPHSSPIMGLTFSDTIGFGFKKDHIKIFLAPRGEATDGPVAFMHRPTGMINPDAPLGHHIGQDVGHITSTVIGESLKVDNTRFEFSTYNGAEPLPQNVDLPLGTPDSYSFRLIEELSAQMMVMASYAYVHNPEPSEPFVNSVNRYSASIYNSISFSNEGTFENAFIYGGISNYDGAATLTSFAEEFLLSCHHSHFWGRIEELQRTPNELQILTSNDGNGGQWVTAVTLGYTYEIAKFDSGALGLGASGTADFIPQDFQGSYGGNPLSGKIFLQMSGMKMWSL